MKIGYISFRLYGNDGVSLEANRWKFILERMGHTVDFIDNTQAPFLYFGHPEILATHDPVIFGKEPFTPEVEQKAELQANMLYEQLKKEVDWSTYDRLVVANCFSLPMNFSAAIALNRIIEEFKIPAVSRNHDFWWERIRFEREDCQPFFLKYFVPEQNRYLTHVTINSIAQKRFFDVQGLQSVVMPDTFDFESGLDVVDSYSRGFRSDIGLTANDIVFLQATRIIPRKRIEWAMELVKRLDNPNVVLVLAGDGHDEGREYQQQLERLGKDLNIRCLFVGDRIDDVRRDGENGKVYTLWDAFNNCDWMTYPSEVEGFGNQFIEGVYFRKPIFLNRYEVYRSDIEPLGFEAVMMNGQVTDDVVSGMKKWMMDKQQVHLAVEKNYEIAKEHFSYEATRKRLKTIGF